MADEKYTQVTEKAVVEQYYKVICGYIEFCIRTIRTKLSEKDKEDLSPSEIAQREEELKVDVQKHEKQKKTFQQEFENLCGAIAEGGISCLSTYVDITMRVYQDKPDWKRDIKAMIVSPRSLKLFRDARVNMVELYPLLLKLNKTFSLDEYSELSVAPTAALYGSEINKTQRESTKKIPLRNEDIQAMLDTFAQLKDTKRLGEWILAILCFDPSKLIDGFQSEFITKREHLKGWVFSQASSSECYRDALTDALIKGNKLNMLLDAYITKSKLVAKQAELESKIKALEDESAKEKAEHEERRAKQYAMIQENEERIISLQQRISDFDRCKQQLTEYISKYQIQVAMNERIVEENMRRLREMETEYSHMRDELTETKSRLETVEIGYSALQSDFSLKNNELTRLKDLAAQKEETARVELMKELVTGINEQFYYLTMFYLELKETGKLESEGIELYADTLRNIDSVLLELGIRKIGVIDQKVAYDASVHISTDAKLANGEQVTVSGYGWMIGNDVYIKAPVEKGE